MFCRSCGNQLAEDAAFCGACGTPAVKAPAGPVGPSAPTAPAAPAAPLAESEPTVPLPAQRANEPLPAPESLPAPEPLPASEPLPMQPVPSVMSALEPQTMPLPAALPYQVPFQPGAFEAFPAVAAAPRSPMVPILIGVGALVALTVAGLVLWQTGVLPGWLNIGSKTATSTVLPSVTTSTTVVNPPTDSTSDTPPPDGPVVTALSDADSLDAINSGYTTVTRFEDQFAAKPAGWIWSVWSKKIDTRNDPAALSSLADEAKSWVDDMTTKREEFAALAVSSTYVSYQQDLLGIFDLMVERANIYYKTTAYAVDHPTKANGTQPWRAMQNGQVDGGKSSAQAAADVKAALAAFVLP